jgi:23S rRNA (pseudouridine1915-N3)-methyltransferase
MKIRILLIGKTDEAWLIEAIDKYFKRINNYLTIQIDIIHDLKKAGKISIEQQKEEEGKLIIRSIEKQEFVILLDDKGKERTSLELSDFLQRKMSAGIKTLTFVIGGPYGFSPEVYKTFPEKISMSKLTFSHQMVRLLLLEQIYRSMTILNNEPYHHE